MTLPLALTLTFALTLPFALTLALSLTLAFPVSLALALTLALPFALPLAPALTLPLALPLALALALPWGVGFPLLALAGILARFAGLGAFALGRSLGLSVGGGRRLSCWLPAGKLALLLRRSLRDLRFTRV